MGTHNFEAIQTECSFMCNQPWWHLTVTRLQSSGVYCLELKCSHEFWKRSDWENTICWIDRVLLDFWGLDSVNRIRASGCWSFIEDCQILITYFCSAGQLPFNSEYFHRGRIYADSQVIRVPRLWFHEGNFVIVSSTIWPSAFDEVCLGWVNLVVIPEKFCLTPSNLW